MGDGEMSDLNARIRSWRERQERRTSLSPRELDELEDHLRARVDLEMELNAVLAPTEAFAIARREIGAPAALAREFAKAGGPRWWKGAVVAGWTMFAASFVLPVAGLEFLSGYGSYGRASGFEVFLRWLPRPELFLAVVPNFAMLLTIPALWGGRFARARWLRRFLGLAGACALGVGIILSLDHAAQAVSPAIRALFGTGYWTWAASFVVVATGLRLRYGKWVSARLRGTARAPGRGAFE